MAYSERHKLLQIIYTCDTPTCQEVLAGDVIRPGERVTPDDFGNRNQKAEQQARVRMMTTAHDAGWSTWKNDHGHTIDHCPHHQPEPGHAYQRTGPLAP